MSKIVCSICKEVHDHINDGNYPIHPEQSRVSYDFKNSDEFLTKEVAEILEYKRSTGLDGLVGDFTGFFTKQNVTLLTGSTDKQ